MTVTLPKGGNMLLADEAPGIACVRVGLGWTVKPGSGAPEIDGLVGVGGPTDGGTPSPARFALVHQVPNPGEPLGAPPPPAATAGDVEKLVVTLAEVPADIQRVLFGATIYDAARRRQSFGSVTGAYIRLVNDDNGVEVARFTLDPTTGAETAMIFGELYRHPKGWKFRAVGQGYDRGLRALAAGAAGTTGATELVAVPPVQLSGYLRRSSSARTRRNLAEHLDPPRPAAPQPAAPAPVPPPPAPKPAPKPAPAAAPRPAPATPRPAPTRPATPPPAPTPPPPAQPAASPSSSGSLLDLSGPSGPPTPARPPAPSASRPPTAPPHPGPQPSTVLSPAPGRAAPAAPPIAYSEHSSRHRQRAESVSVLDEGHPATTWTEQQRGTGRLVITLTWEPLKTARGLPKPSDIHLGALWQAGDRAEGLLQFAGGELRAPGAAGPRQVLALGRRDENEGQTIFVDLAALPTFRRFFVYAYGVHAAPEWAQLRPTLTVQAPSGEALTIRPGDLPSSARLDVLTSFHVVHDDLVIRREDAYQDDTLAAAAARFGWELDWAPDGMGLRVPG